MFVFLAAYMTYVYSYQGVYCRKCEQMFKKKFSKTCNLPLRCGTMELGRNEAQKIQPRHGKTAAAKSCVVKSFFCKKNSTKLYIKG